MTDETTAGGIDEYADQLLETLKAARSHGISAYCILHTVDPIAMTSHTRYVQTADHVLAMGMIQAASGYVQDEYFGAEEADD
jgi:ABC-type branched-subunit amino acid transport system ATPase component